MRISKKVKTEVERSPIIANTTGLPKEGESWSKLTRTVFERIARKINQEVTNKVINYPTLVFEFLLFGPHEFKNIRLKYDIEHMEEFLDCLKQMSKQKPHIWISGKTLQSYWNGGHAKDKKLNILLTFLGIDFSLWDDYKQLSPDDLLKNEPVIHQNGTLNLIRKHFVGCYFRYFQKSDGSPVLVKAPFVIQASGMGHPTAKTKVVGHSYKSSYMIIRNGALYIECENLEWNEKETYIFNVGFESNPDLILGVSNTLNRKGQAIALRNMLVKQKRAFDFRDMEAVEIPYHEASNLNAEEARVLEFFRKSSNNIITTDSFYALAELPTPTVSEEYK